MRLRQCYRAAAVAIAATAVAAACNKAFIAPETELAATATLNAQSEVPAVTAPGTGTATLRRPGEGLKYMNFVVNLTGVTAVTKMDLHLGTANEAGPVLVTMYDAPATGAINGVFMESNFGESEMTPKIKLDSLQKLIAAGRVYINVHTTDHPDGEIRGQLKP